MNGGSKTWYFPDGYLPEKTGGGAMEAHEALMLFNTGAENANVLIYIYYSDKAPDKDISVKVEAERITTLRLDNPEDIGGVNIPPLTQYGIRVKSDKNIIVQFGRLDTTQVNMAYYGCIGYSE